MMPYSLVAGILKESAVPIFGVEDFHENKFASGRVLAYAGLTSGFEMNWEKVFVLIMWN